MGSTSSKQKKQNDQSQKNENKVLPPSQFQNKTTLFSDHMSMEKINSYKLEYDQLSEKIRNLFTEYTAALEADPMLDPASYREKLDLVQNQFTKLYEDVNGFSSILSENDKLYNDKKDAVDAVKSGVTNKLGWVDRLKEKLDVQEQKVGSVKKAL